MDKNTEKILKNPANVKFNDLYKICTRYFDGPRITGSHHIFQTPWIGIPLVNIQNKNGMAKPYQVKEVHKAIKKLEEMKNNEH